MLAVATLLLSPFVLGLLRYGAPLEYLQRRPFDTEGWRNPQSDHDRLRMVDDLVDNVLKVGMSAEEVEELLGPKPETSYFRRWDLVYHLGMQRSFFAIDSEWLVIRLDAEGKVTEFKIAVD
jgi:hypothetical protein